MPSHRLLHLTDVHLQPERGAPEGFAQALRKVLAEAADSVLVGGDLVMETLECDADRRDVQWDLYLDVLESSGVGPVVHALGNHDVWGWHRREEFEGQPGFGKETALQRLGLDRPYYTRDLGAWKLIVLDSTHRTEGNGYTARLDDAQFEWLEAEVAGTDSVRPIIVLSHIPIFAACTFLHGKNEETGQWRVPGAWMHLDVRRIQNLFRQHPNVRLCLSGHMHLVDRVDYMGVTYLCHGAVCGSWWNGPFLDQPAGYARVDLHENGTWSREFVTL